jgi:hypothetical protein
MIEKREKMEAGTIVFPRTRTSRVPIFSIRYYLSRRLIHTISRLIKAMLRIAVTCENNNFVTPILQAHCSVDDQSFGASDSKIRMEECYILLLAIIFHGGGFRCCAEVMRCILPDTLPLSPSSSRSLALQPSTSKADRLT